MAKQNHGRVSCWPGGGLEPAGCWVSAASLRLVLSDARSVAEMSVCTWPDSP